MPIGDDHPIEPDSPYGCIKLCEEKLCLAYYKFYPIEGICLRYINVYGPNQRFDAMEMLFQFLYLKCFRRNRLLFLVTENKPEIL